MFATGIENGIPKIKGGRIRVDQMESCGHYRHWRKDFDLVAEPTQGVCLTEPVVLPSDYAATGAERQRHDAGRLRAFELANESD
jgi:hypothetical protein